jgi:hypothetical protein
MHALLGPFGRIFLLAALLFVYSAGAALSFIEPQSWAATLCASYGVPLLVVWWAEHDSGRTRFWPAFHYALFLLTLWPIAVPHYVLRTRGWRGLGLAVVLLSAICAPLFGWVAGYLLWPLVWREPAG